MARGRKTQDRKQQEPEQTDEVPAPHSFWSGVITFGLVTLPVSLFPASRGRTLALKMVDDEGTPLARRYYCEKEQRVLSKDDIVRGYPIDSERYVIVKDEELESLAPEKSREIDLRRFVPRDDIDPLLFERGYFLAPDSGATKAYRLLAKSMADEDRVGIATFVLHDKEHLVAILSERGLLVAQTLRFSEDVRGPEEVGLPEPDQPKAERVRTLSKRMKPLFGRRLQRAELSDPEAKRIERLVRDKLEAGRDVVQPPEPQRYEEDTNVIDIMEVLKERLRGGAQGGRRGKNSQAGPARKADDESAAVEIERYSRDELYRRARTQGIRGRSKMTKQELARALSQQ